MSQQHTDCLLISPATKENRRCKRKNNVTMLLRSPESSALKQAHLKQPLCLSRATRESASHWFCYGKSGWGSGFYTYSYRFILSIISLADYNINAVLGERHRGEKDTYMCAFLIDGHNSYRHPSHSSSLEKFFICPLISELLPVCLFEGAIFSGTRGSVIMRYFSCFAGLPFRPKMYLHTVGLLLKTPRLNVACNFNWGIDN